MTDKENTSRTHWHQLLAKLLQELLSPVNITVYSDLPIMTHPPKADILLIRRENKVWTDEQRARLPDGIRDSQAAHILLEFKYTESVDQDALIQAQMYDFLYKQSYRLSDEEVQSFVMSAKKPQVETLKKWDYVSSKHEGVYQSQNPLLIRIPLLSLNELSDETHNAWVKCFSSHKKNKIKAFNQLKASGLKLMTVPLEWVIGGLWQYWFKSGDSKMTVEMTPEQVMEMGKMWGESYLSLLPPEERLAGLAVEERLAGLAVEERLAGLAVEDILAKLNPSDIEDFLKRFKPKQD